MSGTGLLIVNQGEILVLQRMSSYVGGWFIGCKVRELCMSCNACIPMSRADVFLSGEGEREDAVRMLLSWGWYVKSLAWEKMKG